MCIVHFDQRPTPKATQIVRRNILEMPDHADRTGRADDARHGILDLCTPTLVVVTVTHGNETQPRRQAYIDLGDSRNDQLAALVFREWIAQRSRLVRGTDD